MPGHGQRALLSLAIAFSAAAGCATVADQLRAGRTFEACQLAEDDVEAAPVFARWLDENLQVQATLVPAAEVETALGGPLAGYGETIGVYRVTASVPGGSVALQLSSLALDGSALVERLPPLVIESEPLIPPGPYDASSFEPEPIESSSGGGSGHNFLGDLIGAFVEVGVGVGRAIGAAVSIPIALTVGIAVGTVETIFDVASYFGGNGGRGGGHGSTVSDTTTTTPPRTVPVFLVKPGKANRLDALLDDNEYRALAEQRRAEWEQRKSVVEAEQRRRVALFDEVDRRLRLGESYCHDCRWVMRPGTLTVTVWPTFARNEPTCYAPQFRRELTIAPVAGARPSWPTPTAPALVVVEDESAPGWGLATPVATPLAFNETSAALGIDDLLCEVQRSRPSRRKTPPLALSVRVTVGRELPRVQRWQLEPFATQGRFVVPRARLQSGERLRLSFVETESGRSLGGGVVEMVGRLPLTIRSDEVMARCTVASAADLATAANGFEYLARSANDALQIALAASDAAAVAASREQARQELVKLAMHVGWKSDRVRALLVELATVDPAERPTR